MIKQKESIKLVSWNVNGIRAIWKKNRLSQNFWKDYDVICFQETKISDCAITDELRNWNTYTSKWACAEKKGYSGVTTYTKKEPLSVSLMDDPRFDSEGRYLLLEFPKFFIINCYFPNSQDKGKRLDYKLDFCATLEQRLNKLKHQDKPIVLCGDYNIAHRPIDLSLPEQNESSPGYLPQERAWLNTFLNNGFTDTFRLFSQEAQYTWWSYRTRARERNIGWRIDYFCIDSAFRTVVTQAKILDEIYGSDHCPIDLTLAL